MKDAFNNSPQTSDTKWVFCLPTVTTPLPPRFLTKFVTDPITGCWNWTAAKKVQRYKDRQYSYGAFAVSTRPVVIKSAHRVAYEAYFGPIPQGLEPDHLCNNSLCVNPFHVEAVTHQVNCARRRKSGPYSRKHLKQFAATSLLLIASLSGLLSPLTPARKGTATHMFGFSGIAQRAYSQLPLNFEPLVTGAESQTEVISQSPAPEPAALPAVLAQIAKKHQDFTDRVLARLSEAERREINTHYQADYRQSWICLSFANKGIADPFVNASYQMYGVHPDKVWEHIVADRKERLGKEYHDWYDSADILRPDVPKIPPSSAAPSHAQAAAGAGSHPVASPCPHPNSDKEKIV